MPRWLRAVLRRVHERAWSQRVSLTKKASEELDHLGPGLEEPDVRRILVMLTTADSAGRVWSQHDGQWRCVLIADVGEVRPYIKLALRDECVVVSFHQQKGSDEASND